MFQITLSIDTKYSGWLKALDECFQSKSAPKNFIHICSERDGILYSAIGCDGTEKRKIVDFVRDSLIKIYLTVVKREYIERYLDIRYTSQMSKRLIACTLVAFDRENEERQLRNDITLQSNFSIDGFYHFRMCEMKNRWRDGCSLASENAGYLSDEETVNELLKFLLCSINSKIGTAEILSNGGRFIVAAGSEVDGCFEFDNFEQLMLFLIDAAPRKIVIRGEFAEAAQRRRISYIFGANTNFL